MLPSGYGVRRATIDDADAIFAIKAAHDVAVLGRVDMTLDDVRDELREPDFDLDRDGWLAHDDAGAPVAWAWACRKGASSNVDIEVIVQPGHETLAPYLWRRAQDRAAAIAAELGHDEATVDIGVYRADKVMRELAAEHGFAEAATFVRMRIDHTGPVDHPEPPAGVRLRHGTDPAVRRDSVDVRNLAFADHFGFVPHEFEEWSAAREASSAHDWALVHVAYCDGEPAATLVRTNNFVPDENCGYVLTLGTVPAHQGKGLGSFLLRYAFAEDAALGRVGTYLHVDTNPERPALRLYEKNGMRPALTIDIWRRTLPASS